MAHPREVDGRGWESRITPGPLPHFTNLKAWWGQQTLRILLEIPSNADGFARPIRVLASRRQRQLARAKSGFLDSCSSVERRDPSLHGRSWRRPTLGHHRLIAFGLLVARTPARVAVVHQTTNGVSPTDTGRWQCLLINPCRTDIVGR